LCVATAAVAISAFIPAGRAETQDLRPHVVVGISSLESQLLTAVNDFRAARGQRPYRASTLLHAAAVRHSAEMSRFGYFAHASPGGGPFWRRISWYYPSRGYRVWEVGENIEYGQPGLAAAQVLRDWLASPGHRANLVSTRWRDAGIGAVVTGSAPGVYGGLPTTIVTLDVGRRRR
jgi:uncharacterized protein YkwD